MKVPELKGGQMLTLLYIAAFMIALFVVYKILAAIGLVTTRKEKIEEKEEKEAETQLRESDYFSPTFLKDKTSQYVPLGNAAKQAAVDIRAAVVGLGTNEEKIFTTFGRLKSKWNISEVSLCYKQGYNRDMLTDLLNDLNDEERLTLFNIVKKLPEK
jgi:hypothetical protein